MGHTSVLVTNILEVVSAAYEYLGSVERSNHNGWNRWLCQLRPREIFLIVVFCRLYVFSIKAYKAEFRIAGVQDSVSAEKPREKDFSGEND